MTCADARIAWLAAPGLARLAASAGLALFVLAPGIAVAEGPARTVVVLQAPGADAATVEATTRVQGELAAAGFHVVVLPTDRDRVAQDVETAGSELAPVGAFAIFVRPEDHGEAAEIWVSDRLRQRTVIQRASLARAEHDRESEILAIRAVELLRASLADLWWPPTQAAKTAEPRRDHGDAASPAAGGPPEPRGAAFGPGFGVRVGVGVLDSLRGPGPTWAPAAGLSYGADGGLRIGLSLQGLGPATSVSAAAGSARVVEQLVTADVAKTWWPHWVVAPFACAGVGAQHVHVMGSASPPYVGETADAWALVTSVGIGASALLHEPFSFVLDARALLAWPPAAVRIAGLEVAQVGAPSFLAQAGLLGMLP